MSYYEKPRKLNYKGWSCTYGWCGQCGMLGYLHTPKKNETIEEAQKRHIKEEHPRIYKQLYKAV